MHDDQAVADSASDIIAGNAALWIGPDLMRLEGDESKWLTQPWLMIWSESRASEHAQRLRDAWKTSENPRFRERTLIEVPQRVEDTLGERFSLAQLCPYLYLNGRGTSDQVERQRDRQRAFDKKIDLLDHVSNAILIVSGYRDPSAFLRLVAEQFPLDSLRTRVLLTETDSGVANDLSRLIANIGLANLGSAGLQVRATRLNVGEVLRQVRETHTAKELPSNTILVDKTPIRIADLPILEPPIDQDFLILTVETWRYQEQIDRTAVIDEFLRGKAPSWQAFAHKLHWQRNKPLIDNILARILQHSKERRANPGDSYVLCIDVSAETGAGLTTILQELSYRVASLGFATLYKRPGNNDISIDRVRVFLEQILSSVDKHASGPTHFMPVLVFDDLDTSEFQTQIHRLPYQLAHDRRAAVIIRGIHDRAGDDVELGSEVRSAYRHGHVDGLRSVATVRSSLTDAELASLVDWAAAAFPGRSSAWLRDQIDAQGTTWEAHKTPSPFLVCLYFIIKDKVPPGNLGKHLSERMRPIVELRRSEREAATKADVAATSPRPATTEEMRALAAHLSTRWDSARTQKTVVLNAMRVDKPRYTVEALADYVCLLSALGTLRISISVTAIASILQLDRTTIRLITEDLATIDLVSEGLASDVSDRKLSAPTALYDLETAIGLRHPAFGRLILEWLCDEESQADFLHCSKIGGEIVAELRQTNEGAVRRTPIEEFPIKLLGPVLSRTHPTRHDLELVEMICSRYLRLQRVARSRYHEWLWRGGMAGELLALFDRIPESVSSGSASVLHSRAITLYKSCDRKDPNLRPDQWRDRYARASEFCEVALRIAESSPMGENPSNILTSQGLLYVGWADIELSRSTETEWYDSARERGRDCLRRALAMRPENPYAVYGLAILALQVCERIIKLGKLVADDKREQEERAFGQNLEELFSLLQESTNDDDLTEWEDVWKRAMGVLSHDRATALIQKLKSKRRELGLALEALRALDGRIPKEIAPTTSGQILTKVWNTLNEYTALNDMRKKSDLARLMRYAVYSAHPSRESDPQFLRRYELIRILRGTPVLRDPIWIYDYGMLCYQVAQYREGREAFADLRKGRRFLEVPLARTEYLKGGKGQEEKEPIVAVVRVTARHKENAFYAQCVDPGDLGELLIRASDYRARGLQPPSVGSTVRCRIRLGAGGPAGEPV